MSKCAFCGFTLTDLDHRLSPECPDCGQPLCCHCLESLGVLAAEYAEQAETIERLQKELRDLYEYARPVSQFWNCMDATVSGVPARVRNLQMAVDRTRKVLEAAESKGGE